MFFRDVLVVGHFIPTHEARREVPPPNPEGPSSVLGQRSTHTLRLRAAFWGEMRVAGGAAA